MIKMMTELPNSTIKAIKSLIDDGTIRTWQYSRLTNGNTRLDWIGGRNNWPNLDDKVYFEVIINAEIKGNKYILFVLHTKRGHNLNEAEYAQMHSELTGMLFTHVYSNIGVCGVFRAEEETHKADIIDK